MWEAALRKARNTVRSAASAAAGAVRSLPVPSKPLLPNPNLKKPIVAAARPVVQKAAPLLKPVVQKATSVAKPILRELQDRKAVSNFANNTLNKLSLTDNAKGLLKPISYRPLEADSGNKSVGGEYTYRGSDFHNAISKALPKPVANFVNRNPITRLVGKLDRPNIELNPKDLGRSAETVLAHESSHHLFEKSPMGTGNKDPIDRANKTADWLRAWNQTKNDPDAAPLLQSIDDRLKKNSRLYDPTDERSVATERYAYLAQRVAKDGLGALPPALRPFYAGYIKGVEGKPVNEFKSQSPGNLLTNTIKGIPEAAKGYAKGILNADVGKAFGDENLNRTTGGKVVNTALGVLNPENHKHVGQSAMRAYAGLGNFLEQKASGNKNVQPLTPQTQFQKDLYGTDKPITLRSVGAEFPGVKEGGFVAPVLGFASGAGDLVPGGSGVRQGVKGAAKAATPLLKKADKAFEGFKDITTKVLSKLEGRAKVSRQYIEDLTNSPDLKQAERDTIRRVLTDEKDTVSVPDFANKVKSELLPLDRYGAGKTTDDFDVDYRYENITLPDELRGPIANYSEHLYESPIKTSAGSVHYGDTSPNYFAHSRIEDLPVGETKQTGVDINGWPIYDIPQQGAAGGTRRVIEIQSDLFQKGRLEGEIRTGAPLDAKLEEAYVKLKQRKQMIEGAENRSAYLDELAEIEREMRQMEKDFAPKALAFKQSRESELAKLEPYRNTWHERVIREEVKQAAIDGKTKLQFPTGETIMKIEGLGGRENGWTFSNPTFNRYGVDLNQGNMRVGMEVIQDGTEKWIITDVLGDGKFKAVPKKDYEALEKIKSTGDAELVEITERTIGRNAETFDISGKVDTENPIYKFYDKTVGKYLVNKYGATRVKDAQGVEWWELPVNEGAAHAPVEAYGFGAGFEMERDENGKLAGVKFNPEMALAGAAGVGALRRITPKHRRAAEADWEHRYAEATTRIFNDTAKIQEALKKARVGEKPALLAKLRKLNESAANIEEDFLKRWDAGVKTNPAKSADTGGVLRKAQQKIELQKVPHSPQTPLLRPAQTQNKATELGTRSRPLQNNTPPPKAVKPLPETFYEANRNTPRVPLLKRIPSSPALNTGADKLLGVISTRLKNIDPSLKAAIRKFEFQRGMAAQHDHKQVVGFLKGFSKLSRADKADLDLALKNGDTAKTGEIVSRNGLDAEYKKVRDLLEEIHKKAEKAGFDIGYHENYFPRVIKDSKGLLKYLERGDDWPVIEDAIKAKEREIGRQLSSEDKVTLINSLLRGYGGQLRLAGPGATKGRKIAVVDAELNRFYADSLTSLTTYIQKMEEAIEARKFFGRGVRTDEYSNIEDSIGAYTLKLIADGKIRPSQEKELTEILQARFKQRGTSGFVQTYKNLSYIDTMGSVISAVTQLGDLAFAVYKAGPLRAAGAFGKAILRRSAIRREDIGIERIAQEFEGSSRSARAVDRVFKLVGINHLDKLGKETVVNATLSKIRSQARKGDPELVKKLEVMFDGNKIEIRRVLEDLAAGRTTDDVKLIAFNELADVQPIALSEMPQMYLTSGNGRLLYMLKTYTIKLFDVYRNEVFQQMREHPVKATRNMVYLAASLMAMNATADEIKDFILGRETSLSDRVVDNIARLAGFSKFTVYSARKEGIGTAAGKTILPPFKFLDAAFKDVSKGKIEKTPESVPVVGKLYYWWFGKGSEQEAKEPKSAYDKAAAKAAEKNKEYRDTQIKPIYENVQRLMAEGKEDEAVAIVDNLSDEDYDHYKAVKSAAKSAQTKAGKEAFYPRFLEIRKVVDSGDEDRAQEMVDALTDDEYHYYELLKASL